MLLQTLFVALVFSSKLFSAKTSVPKELFFSLLPDNPIIIEAGAQFGEDTVWMSSAWPKGTIYAFEPNPASYPSLLKMAEQKPNVYSYQLAVSNLPGEMPFYIAGGASSLLPPTDSFNDIYFHADKMNPIRVQTIQLDDWLDEQRISKVDFLWFDLEGNELNALEGLQRHLSNITLIYTEVNLQNFWEEGVLYESLKNWLEARGFTEIWSEIAPYWQGNALFLNQNMGTNRNLSH